MGHTLLGGGSPLNKFKEINAHLSRNSRTVYVELDGDDVNGDGSIEKPFLSIAQALTQLTGTTRGLTVSIGQGVHNYPHLKLFNATINITGLGTLNMVGAASGEVFRVEYGHLVLTCAHVVSTSPVNALFGMGPSAVVYISTDLSCENAAEIASDYYGGSVFIAESGTITNNGGAAIPLMRVKHGTSPEVIQRNLTLTNVTG